MHISHGNKFLDNYKSHLLNDLSITKDINWINASNQIFSTEHKWKLKFPLQLTSVGKVEIFFAQREVTYKFGKDDVVLL